MDQMTSAAKPDPWLAQKVRSRAQGKEEEPMRKKLPAGLVIVLAIMFLMTAVAAAVTNGFGLLRYYPKQTDNTAFTDRIVSIGQTWEGKYFSAEINEAVFDGYKLRFTMNVTPKEGAEQVFVYPVAKAVCGDKLRYASCINVTGWAENGGFWVPDLKPLIPREDFDLSEMVYEISLLDDHFRPTVVNEDAEWTITFNVLHTDWKVSFGDSGFGNEVWSDEKWAEFQKREFEAYDRHELLLDEYGYGMEEVIQHPYIGDDSVQFEEYYEDPSLTWYTKDVFTLEEQAVFSFVADRAEVRKAETPISFVLPEKQKCEVQKAEATADGVTVIIQTKYYHAENIEFLDDMPWNFVLKSDEAELEPGVGCVDAISIGDASTKEVNYTMEYEVAEPISSVRIVPVQHTESGDVEREDLAIVLELK